MIDAASLKAILDLGIPTAIIVIMLAAGIIGVPKFLTWYTAEQKRRDDTIQQMQGQMIAVVGNNTEALTRLVSASDLTTDKLSEHDARAERMEAATGQIMAATGRIEQKLDQALEPRKRQDRAG